MDLGLKGKRALVTGSTAGIGLATALALASEGAHVTLNGRTEARVAAAVEKLKRELPSALPELDVLVNNLGIFEPKAFADIPDEDWLRFFETNVLSGIRLSRHYVGGMRSRLGADRVRLERIRPADPGRDDPLRHDQDRAARRGPRARRDARRHRRHGE